MFPIPILCNLQKAESTKADFAVYLTFNNLSTTRVTEIIRVFGIKHDIFNRVGDRTGREKYLVTSDTTITLLRLSRAVRVVRFGELKGGEPGSQHC